jgi:protoporphyrinogen oxidase
VRIAIFGSGPSGLITAYLLSLKKYQVDVFEATGTIGGLAQSINLWGKNVEIGPHFLDMEGPLKELVTELFAESEILKYNRNTLLLLKNKRMFSYPPTFYSLIKGLSFIQIISSAVSFLLSKVNPNKNYESAQQAMIAEMGSYLFKLFFKDYSEKLWNKKCYELDTCYCRAMIPFKKRTNILTQLLKPKKQSIALTYFPLGVSHLWDKLYTACGKGNVNFKMNHSINRCEFIDKQIKVSAQNGYTNTYDFVISSLPNSVNRNFFGLPNINQFNFRNLILVYIKTKRVHVIEGQCLFLYGKDIKAIRITDFSNFPQIDSGFNVILFEYWVDKDGMWLESDSAIIHTVKQDMVRLNLSFKIIDFHVKRISNAYRVPDLGLERKLKDERLFFANKNFFSIGRSNSPHFNYGMDSAIVEAVDLCKQL